MIALKPPLSITILFRVRQTKKKRKKRKGKKKSQIHEKLFYFRLGLQCPPPHTPLPEKEASEPKVITESNWYLGDYCGEEEN